MSLPEVALISKHLNLFQREENSSVAVAVKRQGPYRLGIRMFMPASDIPASRWVEGGGTCVSSMTDKCSNQGALDY